MNSDLQKAVKRAESRAAVYSSLEKAYGSETITKQGPSKPLKSQIPYQQNFGSDSKVFESLQDFISDRQEKTKKYLQEQLIGKSLVINSLKLKTEANKAKNRIQK
jgi:hypothetical protein